MSEHNKIKLFFKQKTYIHKTLYTHKIEQKIKISDLSLIVVDKITKHCF